jgi:WD40 repeat protein
LPVEATVQTLTYADEGRQLVALLADGQLVTWAAEGLQQPADNSPSQPPERWSSGVQPARALAAIAPQTMAIAGENGRIVVAGRPSAQEKWQEAFALLSASPVRGLAYSGSSATLSVGSEDQLVHVWDIDRREEALVLKGHTGRILAVATPADGRWLASSGFDGAIKIWRLREAGGPSGAGVSPGIEGSPDTDVSSEAPNP